MPAAFEEEPPAMPGGVGTHDAVEQQTPAGEVDAAPVIGLRPVVFEAAPLHRPRVSQHEAATVLGAGVAPDQAIAQTRAAVGIHAAALVGHVAAGEGEALDKRVGGDTDDAVGAPAVHDGDRRTPHAHQVDPARQDDLGRRTVGAVGDHGGPTAGGRVDGLLNVRRRRGPRHEGVDVAACRRDKRAPGLIRTDVDAGTVQPRHPLQVGCADTPGEGGAPVRAGGPGMQTEISTRGVDETRIAGHASHAVARKGAAVSPCAGAGPLLRARDGGLVEPHDRVYRHAARRRVHAAGLRTHTRRPVGHKRAVLQCAACRQVRAPAEFTDAEALVRRDQRTSRHAARLGIQTAAVAGGIVADDRVLQHAAVVQVHASAFAVGHRGVALHRAAVERAALVHEHARSKP